MPVPPPAVDLVALLFWRRVEAWVANPDNFAELGRRVGRYREAVTRGPSIVDRQVDRAIWVRLTDHWRRNCIYH